MLIFGIFNWVALSKFAVFPGDDVKLLKLNCVYLLLFLECIFYFSHMNIEYKKFVNESMLEFVKKILTKIQHENLYWDQLIYISYRTDDPEVILPSKVKQSYPKQITIVLQYQFENLIVNDAGFSLMVSFDGVKEMIYVPFDALISFVDSNNNYSLTFNQSLNIQENHQYEEEISNNKSYKTSLSANPSVIMLDKFRNSSKPS